MMYKSSKQCKNALEVIEQLDMANKDLLEASKLISKLYNKLGDISPVSACEFLGMPIDRRVVRFQIRHGSKGWIDWTDGIPIDVLKTWDKDVQTKILHHYNCTTWEEFETDIEDVEDLPGRITV